METIIDILTLIWNVISSDSGSNILTFFLFIIQMIMIYASVVMLLNVKLLQIRKEKSMDYVDSTMEDVNQLLIKKYYNLAEVQFGEDYLETLEVQVIEYLYRKALDCRKHEMRKRVRKNGFDLKSPEEWRIYVDHEIKEDITAVTRYLTSMWPRNATIKRNTAYDENMKMMPEIQHCMGNLYSEMLAIANSYKLRKFFFWILTL